MKISKKSFLPPLPLSKKVSKRGGNDPTRFRIRTTTDCNRSKAVDRGQDSKGEKEEIIIP